MALNERYNELIGVINDHFVEPKKTEESYRDYNKMVAILNEDAEREADQKKESKIKR